MRNNRVPCFAICLVISFCFAVNLFAGVALGGEVYGWGEVKFPNTTMDQVTQIAGTGRHNLALRSDGSIFGWGGNYSGQADTPTGNDFIAVSGGHMHSIALKSDGSIIGWGISDGSVVDNGQATAPAGHDFVAIFAASYHNLALKSDGSILGWGRNLVGEASPPAGNDFVAISAGFMHSIALKSDGSIVGWGAYWQGLDSPPAGNDFVAIAAGSSHNLALKSDGSIVGWGNDLYGKASPPAGNDFVAIAAGGEHSIALKSDGSIVGWGINDGSSRDYGQSSPPSGNDFVVIFAGYEYGFAIRSDGSIVGWGNNGLFFAGDDFVAVAAYSHTLALKSNASIVGFPGTQPAGDDFIAIAVGGNINSGGGHSLAVKSDGSILGWGNNDFGQAMPLAGNDFVAIAAGDRHSLALKSDGSLVGWGDNEYGKASPPAGNDYVAIAAGDYHNLALKSDGSIVGWGNDYYGDPPAGTDFVAVSAGFGHSLALKSDGSIVGWGKNNYGQASPPDSNDVDFVAIAAGSMHSLALKSDGSIVGWGMNVYGQATPPAGNDFVAIAVGRYRSLAIKGPLYKSPAIGFWPGYLSFTAYENGANPPDKSFDIRNIGIGTLNWTISESCSWLSITPESGNSAGEDNTITVSVDITGLSWGSYSCDLLVSDPGAVNNPQMVTVTLGIVPVDENLWVPVEYPTIQSAINAAGVGDTVMVFEGRYYESINFGGKDIVLRSIDPDDPNIVANTIIDGRDLYSVVTFAGSETSSCKISGFTITRGSGSYFRGAGIDGNYTYASIENCIISNNHSQVFEMSGGGISKCNGTIQGCVISGNTSQLGGGLHDCDGIIANCLIIDNTVFGTSYEDPTEGGTCFFYNGEGGGLAGCDGTITNCTIVGNKAEEVIGAGCGGYSRGGGLYGCSGIITNSIIYGNTALTAGDNMYSSSTPSYSCIESWGGGGVGNISDNPWFAGYSELYWDPNDTPADPNDDFLVGMPAVGLPDDYHLRSAGGRWDPVSLSWVSDPNTSACVDVGDPNTLVGGELWPHGGRVNIGAYGGTKEASMSLSLAGNVGDLDNDGGVGVVDFGMFGGDWGKVEFLLNSDIDRDGDVDVTDLWLWLVEWMWEDGL